MRIYMIALASRDRGALVWMVGLGLALGVARAENWPQWRGPTGDGVSLERNLPVEWSATKNIAWKVALPGEGHSSPAIWGESVFVTGAVPETQERVLMRLNATTGDLVWQRTAFKAPLEPMHRENSAASSTPVTDGRRIFTSFQNGSRVDVRCFDLNGEELWAVRPLSFEGMHGYSYTPVVQDDLVIFDFAQNDEAAVVALEAQTGKVRWRVDRRKKEISHVTPLLVSGPGGERQVVVCGADETRGLDPQTGRSLWWCQGPTDVCVAGMAFGQGNVFVAGGYPRKTRMAIGIDGQGEVSGREVAWSSIRQVTYVPSPVYANGCLYTVLDDGMLVCADAANGNAIWEERLRGRFRSSLVLADGNIYATNDKGVTTVFRATRAGFERVAENDLGEFCYATPAISNGRIFLRTGGHLYCIRPNDAAN